MTVLTDSTDAVMAWDAREARRTAIGAVLGFLAVVPLDAYLFGVWPW